MSRKASFQLKIPPIAHCNNEQINYPYVPIQCEGHSGSLQCPMFVLWYNSASQQVLWILFLCTYLDVPYVDVLKVVYNHCAKKKYIFNL
jgi:hypothetical protein